MIDLARPTSAPTDGSVDRVYLSRAERLARREEYDRLRRRYTVLSELARRCSSDPRIVEPLLLRMARRVVDPGKVAWAALQEVDGPSEQAALPGGIERLLDVYESRIRPLVLEMSRLDRLTSYAREAHDCLENLARTGRGRAVPLRGLTRRILADVRDSAAGRLDETEPGLDLVKAVTAAVDQPAIASCLAGIQAARLLAWFAPQYLSCAAEAERLTTAAIVSSAALVHWHELRGLQPERLRRERPVDFESAPRLSAALAGGLEPLDAAIPSLVATMSERLDGTGRPAGLNRWRLSPGQRLVQIAARFVELRHGLPVSADVESSAVPIDDVGASRRLWDEAERGRFDLVWTRAFLGSIGAAPAPRSLDEPVIEPALSDLGRRRLRIDPAHPGAPAAHVLPAASPRRRDAEAEQDDEETTVSGTDASAGAPRGVPRPAFLKVRGTDRRDVEVGQGVRR